MSAPTSSVVKNRPQEENPGDFCWAAWTGESRGALALQWQDVAIDFQSMKPQQARDLNDLAVRHLVNAHARLDEPLLLAIRFKLNETGIHLVEVLEGFPGAPGDDPVETEFGPSPDVRMVGPLKLTLVNPQQLRALVASGSALCKMIEADGRIEYVTREGRELAQLLNLQDRASPRELAARKELLLEVDAALSDSDREVLKKAWG